MPKERNNNRPAKTRSKLPPFEFKECSILISPTGQKASNLAQLVFALRHVDPQVIYHHVYRCFLKHTYQQSPFPNDFAIWAAQALDDYLLAEKLANLDPYEECGSIEEVREYLVSSVEDHLAERVYVPVAKPGFDFFFERSVLHVADSGLVAHSVGELAEKLQQVQVSAVYYHFYDARRRLGGNLDDFRRWLMNDKKRYKDLIRRIGEIDFYLIDLEELRSLLARVLQEGAPDD
jgi:hypothetical protein